MKKNLIVIILTGLSQFSFAQKEITFKIEELSKPNKLLFKQSTDNIYKKLILEDSSWENYEVKKENLSVDYNILAKSNAPDSLVNFSYNSFFNGMYAAYADHRPFVLSPDMMWLLISQGFARHINSNPEKYRDYLVKFDKKASLIIESDFNLLKEINPTKWEGVFSDFNKQIGKHTGENLIDILTPNFSTTGITEKIASEITIMEAIKPYFDFIVMRTVCGIPEITLKGTPDDWQKVLNKAQMLKKYDLEWWIDQIEPILKEFVKASEGQVDKDFWRNIFKYHSKKIYGNPKIINGWIIKFFPYNKDGKRNNLKEISKENDRLPEEIVKVDVEYIETDGAITSSTMLELWSGFIGLKQDPKTFALTPQIGWMIRKKDTNNDLLLKKIKKDNKYGTLHLHIIEEVPQMLKQLQEINNLTLSFKKEVSIPDWLKDISIRNLIIYGEINQKEMDKIIKDFPNTSIRINDKVHQRKNIKIILI